MKQNFCIFIFTVWISLQLLVVISIELPYNDVKQDYLSKYNYMKESGFNDINATWSIADNYCTNFSGTYGNKDDTSVNRKLFKDTFFICIFLNPILSSYFLDSLQSPGDGFYKLVIVQNKGACQEFAFSMKKLIEDVTGFNSRIIVMEGKDHAFPEVKINNEWWVFDRIYTTPNRPIRSSDYASDIAGQEVFESIHNLHEFEKNESLLDEHGFNASNLTISAIFNPTALKTADKPLNDTTIEIFAYDNSFDPLVNTGTTDNNGNYSTRLRSGKKYLVIAKDKNIIKSSVIGIENIYLPLNSNYSINIYLHKYE